MKPVSFFLTLCSILMLQTNITGQSQYAYSLQNNQEIGIGNLGNPFQDFLNSSFRTSFSHLQECLLIGSQSADFNPLPLSENGTFTANQLTEAIVNFEDWKIESSQKVFAQICEMDSDHNVARFYLGLCQLYRGFYGPAAKNLSLILKNIKLNNQKVTRDFEEDVCFYMAISCMMIPDSRQITKSLFQKLCYEGCKYKEVCQGLIELL